MDYQLCVHLVNLHGPSNPKCVSRKSPFLSFAPRVFLLLLIAVYPLTCAAVVENADEQLENRCGGDLNFRVVMDYSWEPLISVGVEQDGPGFMSLLCVAHGPRFQLWSTGKENSPTINTLLQTQNFSAVLDEVKGNMTLNRVKSYNLSTTKVVKSPGVDVANVTVSPSINATLISCIAGIIPSPDWFTGISNLEMCKFNRSTNSSSYPANPTVVDLRTYDAEFNDLETQKGQSIVNKEPRPVRLRLDLGESLGQAQISIPGQTAVPSQTARGSESEKNGAACFPGTAIVETDDGRKVLMRDLLPSQRIRSAEYAFSEVFMFSHHDPHIWTPFVTLRFLDTSVNKSGTLTASRGHYVYVLDDSIGSARARLTAMDTVRRHDRLVSAKGRPLHVSAVATTWGEGLYNPHTIDGDLVVDGVLVSSFTRAVAPEAAKRAMQPLRIMYTWGWSGLVQLVTKGVLSGRFNPVLARLLPSGK